MAGKSKKDGAQGSDSWGGVRPNSGRPTNGEVINNTNQQRLILQQLN